MDVHAGDGEGDFNGDGDGEKESAAMSALLSYLRSAIDLCLHIAHFADAFNAKPSEGGGVPRNYAYMGNAIVRKIPFLLLEDTLDTLPLAQAKSFWSAGPGGGSWMAVLCSEVLFNTGSRLTLIRVCNKLLRKLSNRGRDAEFAGRIMMLLAGVFPLSERSGVNVLGTFNVTNGTEYETKEEWEHAKLKAEVEEEAQGGMAEDQEEGEEGNGRAGNDDPPSGDSILDYPFYRRFWGVQLAFTNPKSLMPGFKVGAFSGIEMGNFIADVQTVLAAFEGAYSFSHCLLLLRLTFVF